MKIIGPGMTRMGCPPFPSPSTQLGMDYPLGKPGINPNRIIFSEEIIISHKCADDFFKFFLKHTEELCIIILIEEQESYRDPFKKTKD